MFEKCANEHSKYFHLYRTAVRSCCFGECDRWLTAPFSASSSNDHRDCSILLSLEAVCRVRGVPFCAVPAAASNVAGHARASAALASSSARGVTRACDQRPAAGRARRVERSPSARHGRRFPRRPDIIVILCCCCRRTCRQAAPQHHGRSGRQERQKGHARWQPERRGDVEGIDHRSGHRTCSVRSVRASARWC